MRLFVIGDVHGMLKELELLVAKLDPRAGDRFAFLGDLVDKGPDSVGVLGRVRALLQQYPGSLSLCGNHEDSSLRQKIRADKAGSWNHLKRAEKEPWLREASDEDFAFMASFPLVARPLEGVILVHGGMFPAYFDKHGSVGEVPASWHKGGGKRMDRMRRFLRIRHVHRETGQMVSLGDEGEHTQPWQDWYDGREGFAFYGHAPIRGGEPLRSPHAMGLDTGAVLGGRLTAAVIGERFDPDAIEVVSVPASQAFRGWLDHVEEDSI